MAMDPNNPEWFTVLFPGGGNQDAPPGCSNAVGKGCLVLLAIGAFIIAALSH